MRSRLEESSLQYGHLLSSTPRTTAYSHSRRSHETWEQVETWPLLLALLIVLHFSFTLSL